MPDSRDNLEFIIGEMPIHGFTPAKERDVRDFLTDSYLPHLRVPELFRPVFDNLRIIHKPGRPMYQPNPMTGGGRLYLPDPAGPHDLKAVLGHELTHGLHVAHGHRVREGLLPGYDQARNWQGGLPDWQFNPMQQPHMYLFKNDAGNAIGFEDCERFYQARVQTAQQKGYTKTNRDDRVPTMHFPIARSAWPTDITLPSRTPKELLDRLIREANIAWYVVARLAHDNQQYDAMKATYYGGYMGTNAQEALATAAELCFSSDDKRMVHVPSLVYRHPFLLQALLELYNPTQRVADILARYDRPVEEWRGGVEP